LLETGVVADLVSCFVFHADGAFQHMAHAMKYDGFVSIGYLFGHEIGQAMKQRGVEADLLIPIPLHKRKMRERGYNQAELIARGIAEETGIPVRTDVVYRTRYTETQTKLHIDDRKKNVEDAFAVTQHAAAVLGGARCVLVDDVITTGATIVSCAGTLLEAGAQSVLAASIALAE
jgi:ComF family protein